MTEEKQVYEPEVLPPEPKEKGKARDENAWRTWKRSLGPIVAGLLIDAVDLATFGPLGLRMGFLFGAVATYMVCSMYKLPFRYKLWCALGAGVYCTLPGTSMLPLGTLLGTLSCLRR